MAKAKVTSRFQILSLLENFIDSATAKDLGQTVVSEARDNISQGLSPVRGYGRFQAYKNRKSYPGDLKSARPVNLKLSGDMLRGFGFRVSGKDAVVVGMVGGSSFDKEKAAYHQAGTPTMAQRKIVPDEGEEWSVSIMRKIRDVYGKRLENLIRQANKKG